ncbi:TRAP transporter small permease [Ectopseudomonas mendocina]|uniref:TRAP transporter small permease protein n=1 Tax=Ectopseudomonas mendocina TaxID=300 RepID=A0A379IZH7_ECTME|nr:MULTISPECIES: TRAP transporter small permease [Pseudomonas]MDF2075547.1 TRAP transporter small permease [Pseudomonas mendocina]QTN44143.1 TRAP transporter small permease [Pseudomonas mendocina]TRO34328.1 TRAP transporter small permease [Pseudomonas sp. ALS1131]SUD41698.1 putative ABC transporter integral membrane protein [Pseudomonas mendocina]
MKTILTIYFGTLKVLICSSLVCITTLIFLNVVLRYGFNSGLFFSEEISRLAFVWLVFAGAQLMLHEHGHIGVDMLTSRVPPRAAKVMMLLSQVLMLYVTWLFLEGSWKQTLINLHVGAPSTGVSMALFYGAGLVFSVVSMVLIAAQVVANLRAPAGHYAQPCTEGATLTNANEPSGVLK